MKIGLFTDSHYSNLKQIGKTRFPKRSYGKIETAMQAFQREGADYVICLGDLVDHCDNPENEPTELKRIGDLILSYKIPFYCLRGNHDCDNFNRDDFFAIGGFEPTPFSRKFGTTLFLFPDANVTDHGEPYLPGRVEWTNCFLPEEQVKLLRNELQKEDVQRAYVFLHQRLDDCPNERYVVKNAPQIRKILEESGKVKAVFQGHDHKGDRRVLGGIEYITLPGMCEGENNPYRVINLS